MMYENLKIAVIEDDKGLNDLMCRRLERNNHEAIGLLNGSDAIRFLKENEVSLMIVDMNLPDFTGDKLINTLSSNNINVPYIIATGQGSESIAVQMLKKGARDYLVKNSEFLNILPSTVEMVWHEVQLESLLEKAKHKIAVQHASLSEISDFSPHGIIAIDDDNNILTLNNKLLDICGIDKEHKFESSTHFFENMETIAHQEAGAIEAINAVCNEFCGTVFNDMELCGRFYEVYSTPMMNDYDLQSSGRIWYFIDVTDHKISKEQMETEKIEAEESAKMRSKFFASVSHDVRTPLNSIIGFLGLLEDSDITDIQKLYLDSINSSCNHLILLINDILDFTRIEHGSIDINTQPILIRPVLEESINNFIPHSTETGVELILQIDDDVPERINCDTLRFKQILINLLGNAMKFTHEGSVSLLCSITGSNLKIEVIDTGIGISQDVQEYLFSPFTQADPSITEMYGGSGLGLAISKQLAECMGGTLSLESKLEDGSKFTLCLPK